MKSTLCFFLWLCVSALLFLGSAAADVRITVRSSTGQVFRLTDDTSSPIHEGQTLRLGDTVRTGPDGSVVLGFEDGSTVELSADSALTLDETMSHWDGDPGFSLSQLFGTLIAQIKSLRGDDLVVTPSLALGIRGTRFLVSVADDGASVASVESGTVLASTAGAPGIGMEIPITIGQEVLALEHAARLTPGPVNIGTPEAAVAFREQRLSAFLPEFPETIGELDGKMDTLLSVLRGLRSDILQQLELLRDARLRVVRGVNREARREALRELRQDSEQVMIQLRRFRLGAMRGKGIFQRARRLETLLPLYETQTSLPTRHLQEQLGTFLDRRHEVRREILSMGQELREAWQPFRQLFDTTRARPGNRQPQPEN